jgi:hypothetical protein
MQELLELVAPDPLEVELDPLEAVLVWMGPVAGPETADPAVDGGPVTSRSLEPAEAAGLVPGYPEADQLGILNDIAGDLIADEDGTGLDGADRDAGLGGSALGRRPRRRLGGRRRSM